MSFLEELAGLEERVQRRMEELEPLVREYEELEQVARRLGLDVDGARRSRDLTATGDRPKRAGQPTGQGAKNGSSPSPRRASGTRAATRASKPKRSRAKRPGPPRKSADRQQQVLELVRRRPGITVADLGREMQVERTSLYRVVRRLQKDGSVKKEGTELSPA